MKRASVQLYGNSRSVIQETNMSSRTRIHRLLEAFQSNLRTDRQRPQSLDPDEVDAEFSRQMASGELSQEQLDRAFAEHFPLMAGASSALTMRQALQKWLEAEGKTADAAARAFNVPISVVAGFLTSDATFSTSVPAEIAVESRPRVRRLLAAVGTLVTLKTRDDGPLLMAARKSPDKKK